jgi:hypothetical protein
VGFLAGLCVHVDGVTRQVSPRRVFNKAGRPAVGQGLPSLHQRREIIPNKTGALLGRWLCSQFHSGVARLPQQLQNSRDPNKVRPHNPNLVLALGYQGAHEVPTWKGLPLFVPGLVAPGVALLYPQLHVIEQPQGCKLLWRLLAVCGHLTHVRRLCVDGQPCQQFMRGEQLMWGRGGRRAVVARTCLGHLGCGSLPTAS